MTEYGYSLATNLPNGKCNLTILQRQVADSTMAQPLAGGTIVGDVLTLMFDSDLTAADKTTLDGIVAAHQGQGFGRYPQRLAAVAEQTNDTTTDVVAAQAAAQAAPPGERLVTFICEIATTSVVANTGVRAAVRFNGAEVYETSWDRPQWHTFSGSAVVELKAGDEPTLAIAFRRIGTTSNAARIRRIRISIG